VNSLPFLMMELAKQLNNDDTSTACTPFVALNSSQCFVLFLFNRFVTLKLSLQKIDVVFKYSHFVAEA